MSMLAMDLPRTFELPDEVSEWDVKLYFTFLQDHQFGYQAILDELKARGQEQSAEYQHWLDQFKTVERYLARDFNRRYHQG